MSEAAKKQSARFVVAGDVVRVYEEETPGLAGLFRPVEITPELQATIGTLETFEQYLIRKRNE